jgi:hypothetical protein
VITTRRVAVKRTDATAEIAARWSRSRRRGEGRKGVDRLNRAEVQTRIAGPMPGYQGNSFRFPKTAEKQRKKVVDNSVTERRKANVGLAALMNLLRGQQELGWTYYGSRMRLFKSSNEMLLLNYSAMCAGPKCILAHVHFYLVSHYSRPFRSPRITCDINATARYGRVDLRQI